MREELTRNEDVIFNQQDARIKMNRPNALRHHVSLYPVLGWLLLALAALSLWLLRLLGIIHLPAWGSQL